MRVVNRLFAHSFGWAVILLIGLLVCCSIMVFAAEPTRVDITFSDGTKSTFVPSVAATRPATVPVVIPPVPIVTKNHFVKGVNLESNTEYNAEAWAANAFLTFSDWGKSGDSPFKQLSTLPKGSPLPIGKRITYDSSGGISVWPSQDQNGYPLEDAGAYSYMYGYPKGQYKFSKKGSGEAKFSGKLKLVAPGIVEFDPAKSGFAVVNLSNIDPANPPFDLRLTAPNCSEAQVYTPWFVGRLDEAQVKLFRNMDRNKSNHHPVASFAERVLPTQWCQTSVKGLAYEYQIALAAEAGIDLWICVPHLYPRDSVKALAELVKSKTPPTTRIYVEYSNEPWNGSFRQRPWLDQQAKLDTVANTVQKQIVARSAVVSEEFIKVLGDRAIPILSTHTADTGWTTEELKFLSTMNPKPKFYYVAVSSYYSIWLGDAANPGGDDRVLKAMLDADSSDAGKAKATDFLFERLLAGAVPKGQKRKQQADIAKSFGYPLCVYEGGSHLTEANATWSYDPVKKSFSANYVNGSIKQAAADDPRMKKWYEQIYSSAEIEYGPVAVGAPFCEFNFVQRYGRDGDWGKLRSIDQVTSPKWEAFKAYGNN